MLVREAGLVPVALAWQFAPRSRLRARQLGRVQGMLAHASAHVPHYRDRPEYARPIERLEELAALPVLGKQVLRTDPGSLRADGVTAEECQVFRTSGSTGVRVEIWHDRPSFAYHNAALVRRFFATRRYLPWYRLTHIRPFAPPTRGFERLGLFRRHVVLTEAPIAEIAAAVLADRPHVIVGYPVHLRALLRALDADDLARLRSTLRFVMTESELLTPEWRRRLSDAFGVPLFDEYSAYETLNLSYDCAYGRAHLSEDRLWVEIVDDAGRPVPDGVEGRVIVTAFDERAMPLVRYDLGDRGRISPAPCPCRRTFRTIELTVGRTNDRILLPDGRELFPDSFLHIAATFPGVAECFVHQHASGEVEVYVVPSGADVERDGDFDSVRRRLFEIAGGEFPLTVSTRAALPVTTGGKARFITSDLAPDLRNS